MSDPRPFEELETPVALVDLDRVERNLARVSAYCREHSLGWRPHTKTHKTVELGRMQREAGAVGLTVATPREAETMAEVTDDLLVAYPPVDPGRARRIVSLPEDVRVTVGLDSEEALAELARAAASRGRTVGVLVELDLGMGRVGVQRPEDAVRLARVAVGHAGIEYRGVMFYPGHIRRPGTEQGRPLHELSLRLESHVDALRAAGLEPLVVSGGSTPTLWRSHEVADLTEVRPGTDLFNDRTSVHLGIAEWDACAYTVLATVVSTAVPGQAVVDAGSKALAKEELRGDGGGYGAVLGRPEVTVSSLSEEHGVLDLSGSEWRPRVGERVRLVPNHVCVSVNLQDRLAVVRGDERVAEWEVAARGRGRRAVAWPGGAA